MDEHTQAENEALRELFQQEGWRVLMRNTQANIDAFRASFPFNTNTVEQLYFSRGMIATLNVLLNMEAQLEQATAEADLSLEFTPPEDA